MVAIKNMGFPNCCANCNFIKLNKINNLYCGYTHHYCGNPNDKRNSDCPLVEIEERKIGKWIGERGYPICEKCGCNIYEKYISCSDYAEMYKPMKYCPNCGAEMRGGENE